VALALPFPEPQPKVRMPSRKHPQQSNICEEAKNERSCALEEVRLKKDSLEAVPDNSVFASNHGVKIWILRPAQI
jgi:hypothetical protein